MLFVPARESRGPAKRVAVVVHETRTRRLFRPRPSPLLARSPGCSRAVFLPQSGGVFDGVPMSHIDPPDEVVRLAEAQVAAGRAASVEEVVRVGVAALEREQRRYDAKMAELRAAIDDGDASPDAEPGVFDRIRAKYGLPSLR